MVWPAGKFEPTKVTTWPTSPLDGLRLTDGVGMVKVTVFELPLPDESDTTTA
jgi:hypothetical protein